ncbi:MAG: aminomethyltransferase family protein [Clostridiales bacterium]|jgi:glycine cleavage system aminomethyltransferase T|nr:aminomethyltransferase family protein [Clostridiales bacterium]
MLFKEDAAARAQHDAVRKNVGWYRWTHDLLEVTGADSTRFLDYIFVNSIAKAPVGRSKYTAMLDEGGGIIDDVIVTHMGENHYWISTLYVPELKEWIVMHKGELDVRHKELTCEVDMYAVQGPNAPALVNKLASAPVDGLKRFAMAENKIGGISARVHCGGFTGEAGYEIYCGIADSAAVSEAIRKAANEFDAPELRTLEVYVRSLPTEKGLALRQDFYGLNPFEAGIGWSVDFEKDFIGREATARAKEEGTARKLVGIEYEAESYEDISQGERIRKNGRDVGFVRSAVYGYTVEKNIGFAIIDIGKVEIGDRVVVGCNDSPAVIVEKRWI